MFKIFSPPFLKISCPRAFIMNNTVFFHITHVINHNNTQAQHLGGLSNLDCLKRSSSNEIKHAMMKSTYTKYCFFFFNPSPNATLKWRLSDPLPSIAMILPLLLETADQVH